MMMSKPTSETEESTQPLEAPKPATLNVGSVADLERRLAEMGASKKSAAPAMAPPPVVKAPPPAAAPAAAAPAAVQGGKNALLARIMAAKEKQNQKKVAPTPPPPPAAAAAPPSIDLLSGFDAPPQESDLPPPSYETNFLQEAPPPAFDVMEQQQQQPPPTMLAAPPPPQMDFPPPPPIDSILPPPPPLDDILPPPPMPAEGDLLDMGIPSAPSAPMFEDLHAPQQSDFHPPPLPPPMEAAPPAMEPDIDASILNALEPAEREAFLEEQRKILEQIEREKSNNEASGAAARAMAFDQRSSNAVADIAARYQGGGSSRSRQPQRTVNLGGESGEVAVRGSEETQKAIDQGTALIVQCMSCDKWMQVTEEAELMFCPICDSVCPVEKKGAASTVDMEAAAQLAADAELAEKLQKEEYAGAATRRRADRSQVREAANAQKSGSNQSWYNWLTGAPAAAPATRSAAAAASSSRATNSSSSSSGGGGGGGLVSAQTGEESRTYGSGSSGARVAQPSKSMFSCVADSMNTAVTQMYTIQSDEEGNVHGVDSQGLLAMPDVSRQREN